MQREHVRLLVGNYASTRIVEQLASLYSTCVWNPEDIDELLRDRKRILGRRPLPMLEPWLLIFKIDLDYCVPPDKIRTLLMNGRHWRVDMLFLDAHSERRWNPMDRAQIDEILFFPSNRPNYCVDLLRQYLSPRDPKIEEIMCQLKALPFGRCLVAEFKQNTLSLRRPWQLLWTPETHSSFPTRVQERVRLLLLAQRDPGSLLSRLDKACLMEILHCGAALDTKQPVEFANKV